MLKVLPFNGPYSGTNIKIQRIKALRTLAPMFPENIREYGSSDLSGNPFLGLAFCKDWVEARWQDNGYGNPIL